ncbi:hypothetical protein CTAYLR_000227 [Chrysophaeum taylorii]|uniref:Xaa-Pro dipeptidase n=1 Tax=Chrysophaeum taylorii TaxID=2483200 RepID=A0AAD7UH05_9STRA|nr:hypothetical protein CTAYLR_000227 [Chrysophaeum taylorii]
MEPLCKLARLDCANEGVEGTPGGFANHRCFFSRGDHTYKVPLELHAQNRAKVVERVRATLTNGAGAVLVFRGGVSRERDDTDHEELFRQESYFQYLFGVKEPNWWGAIDVCTSEARLYAPKLPPAYAVWMGHIATLDALRERYGVDVAWTDGLATSLPPGGVALCMRGVNSDSGVDIADALPIEESLAMPSPELFVAIADCRAVKSAAELDLMRYVSYATSRAHVAVMRSTKPGDYEYQLEARFLGRIAEDHGCRNCAYTSICACGPNSAVLHYGHAGAPNDRRLAESDVALLDMGAEYHCYCSDVTCSFPVRGVFDDRQRAIHGGVLAAQRAVMGAMKPGVSWAAMHELAEATILDALVDAGVLVGKVEDMLACHLAAVFMPHGLGHLIGLDTHDVGGYLPGMPPRATRPGLGKLRTARVLQAGMALTVEPGIYFIPALIEPALQDARRHFFNLGRLDDFRGFGGVRLEDVVAVTTDGVVNLTLCPRTTDEIESVMAGGSWPPPTDTAPWLFRSWCTYDAQGVCRALDLPPTAF